MTEVKLVVVDGLDVVVGDGFGAEVDVRGTLDQDWMELGLKWFLLESLVEKAVL